MTPSLYIAGVALALVVAQVSAAENAEETIPSIAIINRSTQYPVLRFSIKPQEAQNIISNNFDRIANISLREKQAVFSIAYTSILAENVKAKNIEIERTVRLWSNECLEKDTPSQFSRYFIWAIAKMGDKNDVVWLESVFKKSGSYDDALDGLDGIRVLFHRKLLSEEEYAAIASRISQNLIDSLAIDLRRLQKGGDPMIHRVVDDKLLKPAAIPR